MKDSETTGQYCSCNTIPLLWVVQEWLSSLGIPQLRSSHFLHQDEKDCTTGWRCHPIPRTPRTWVNWERSRMFDVYLKHPPPIRLGPWRSPASLWQFQAPWWTWASRFHVFTQLAYVALAPKRCPEGPGGVPTTVSKGPWCKHLATPKSMSLTRLSRSTTSPVTIIFLGHFLYPATMPSPKPSPQGAILMCVRRGRWINGQTHT